MASTSLASVQDNAASSSAGASDTSRAMDALFTGGSQEGQVQVQEPAPRQSELGDHGKLGEMPGDLPTQSSESEAPGATSTPGSEPRWLEFSVTDDQGRRKMKVDLNNQEQLKKMLPQAAGFRKMQAERDAEKSWRKTAEPRLLELESNWQTLERTYQEGGVEGLVDLLGGKQGHYKEWRDSEFSKHQKFLGATEAEKRAIAAEEQVARLTKQTELREKRTVEETKKAESAREEAQLRSVEAQITPVFNKYRFAGTEGMTAATAAAFDQAIWDQALKNLEAAPEDQPLTNAQIDAEFRKVSTAFKAAIGKQASAKVKEVIDTKKLDAQTRMASAATKGMASRTGTVDQRMAADIKRGGLSGLTDALMHTFTTRK